MSMMPGGVVASTGEAKQHPTAESMIQAAVAANANQQDAFDDDIPMTFPQKLMQIVSDESNNDVIAWLPHGKGFQIYKKKKFASDVLPKAFKQSKYTSFTRKLNRWGFTRVTRGPETGAYYHKYFQRGDTRLCMQMSCHAKTPKAAAANNSSSAQPSQQVFHQQLQQLQMHQFHLQQMQMQQHMQAEMMRQQQQQQNNKGDGDDDDDKKGDGEKSEVAPFTPSAAMPMDQAAYFQSMQATGGMMPFIPGAFVPPGMQPMMPSSGAPVMQQQQPQAPTAADDGTTASTEEGTAKTEEQVEAI